jgi:hypothetical protein
MSQTIEDMRQLLEDKQPMIEGQQYEIETSPQSSRRKLRNWRLYLNRMHELIEGVHKLVLTDRGALHPKAAEATAWM